MSLGGAVLLSVLAYVLMAVIATLAAVMVRGIVVLLQRVQQRGQAVAAPMPVSIGVVPVRDEIALHVAPIAAAVYAVVGPHRLVHISEAPPSPIWARTGRTRLQTSHAPRYTPH
jgi:hypothetical protein